MSNDLNLTVDLDQTPANSALEIDQIPVEKEEGATANNQVPAQNDEGGTPVEKASIPVIETIENASIMAESTPFEGAMVESTTVEYDEVDSDFEMGHNDQMIDSDLDIDMCESYFNSRGGDADSDLDDPDQEAAGGNESVVGEKTLLSKPIMGRSKNSQLLMDFLEGNLVGSSKDKRSFSVSSTCSGVSVKSGAVSVKSGKSTTKSSLSRRTSRAPSVAKEFPCLECGSTFNRQKKLDEHMSAVHLNLRPEVCEICGKTFKRKKHLQRHQVSAHAEKFLSASGSGNSGNNMKVNSMIGNSMSGNPTPTGSSSMATSSSSMPSSSSSSSKTASSSLKGKRINVLDAFWDTPQNLSPVNEVSEEEDDLLADSPVKKPTPLVGNVSSSSTPAVPYHTISNGLPVGSSSSSTLLAAACSSSSIPASANLVTATEMTISSEVDKPSSGSRLESNKPFIRKHVCEQCGARFPTSQKLKKHLISHEKEKLRCQFCNVKFKKESRFRVHECAGKKALKERRGNLGPVEGGNAATNVVSDATNVVPAGKNATDVETSRTLPLSISSLGDSISSLDNPEVGKTGETTVNKIGETVVDKIVDMDEMFCEEIENQEPNQRSAFLTEGEPISPGKFSCPECHKVLSSLEEFDAHRKHHRRLKIHTCDICLEFSTQKWSELVKHKRDHKKSESKLFCCPHCDKVFKQKNSMREHIRYKHAHVVATIDSIDVTGMSVTNNMNAMTNNNMMSALDTSSSSFMQATSSSSAPAGSSIAAIVAFQRSQEMDDPIIDLNMKELAGLNGSLDQTPNNINTVNGKNNSIKNGMNGRNAASGKRFPCDVCGLDFASKSGLKCHVQSQHEAKTWKCSECHKTFTAKSALSRHKKNVHRRKQIVEAADGQVEAENGHADGIVVQQTSKPVVVSNEPIVPNGEHAQILHPETLERGTDVEKGEDVEDRPDNVQSELFENIIPTSRYAKRRKLLNEEGVQTGESMFAGSVGGLF